MADLKISQLPVATTPLAGTELVPIVQGGVTDQTTVQAILTGTVPSGTANGVLYLNGSKVVTSGSGLTFDGTSLGIGTASPTNKLEAAGAKAGYWNGSSWTGGDPLAAVITNTNSGGYDPVVLGRMTDTGGTSKNSFAIGTVGTGPWTAGNDATQTADLYIAVRNGTGGISERMRITSDGNLGIGTNNPVGKLQVTGSGKGSIFGSGSAVNFYSAWQYNSTDVGYVGNGASIVAGAAATDFGLTAFTSGKLWLGSNNGASYAVLDSSGNLGLGVTPSAWNSDYKAFNFGASGFVYGRVGSQETAIGTNWLRNAGASFVYAANGFASYYTQTSGEHSWFTAPSGTAGNAISFTQAMTLNASGNLFIGGTAGAEKLNIIANTATSGLEKGFAVSNDVDSNCFISITGTAATDKRAVIGPTSSTALVFQTNGSARARIPAAGGMVVGTAALATSATDGFLYVPGCAGTPTGTPTAYTGRVPIVVDTTNNKLYFYSGGAWRDAGP